MNSARKTIAPVRPSPTCSVAKTTRSKWSTPPPNKREPLRTIVPHSATRLRSTSQTPIKPQYNYQNVPSKDLRKLNTNPKTSSEKCGKSKVVYSKLTTDNVVPSRNSMEDDVATNASSNRYGSEMYSSSEECPSARHERQKQLIQHYQKILSDRKVKKKTEEPNKTKASQDEIIVTNAGMEVKGPTVATMEMLTPATPPLLSSRGSDNVSVSPPSTVNSPAPSGQGPAMLRCVLGNGIFGVSDGNFNKVQYMDTSSLKPWSGRLSGIMDEGSPNSHSSRTSGAASLEVSEDQDTPSTCRSSPLSNSWRDRTDIEMESHKNDIYSLADYRTGPLSPLADESISPYHLAELRDKIHIPPQAPPPPCIPVGHQLTEVNFVLTPVCSPSGRDASALVDRITKEVLHQCMQHLSFCTDSSFDQWRRPFQDLWNKRFEEMENRLRVMENRIRKMEEKSIQDTAGPTYL